MNPKGMIFSTESVRAILDGRKTMTRRVVKPQPPEKGTEVNRVVVGETTQVKVFEINKGGKKQVYDPEKYKATWLHYLEEMEICDRCTGLAKSPLNVGDIAYVKETWARVSIPDGTTARKLIYIYRADKPQHPYLVKWRSPLFMPKEAARIWLKVVSVRAERLQAISNQDLLAEGVRSGVFATCIVSLEKNAGDMLREYIDTWQKLNAKKDGGIYAWERNPYVWVYEFERVEKPENTEG
jgi:hypothetical protein